MRQRLPLVLSITALAVVLFGSTPIGEAAEEAVSQLVPRNSVGTAQLKRNAVGTLQLKRSAVTSNKVKNPLAARRGLRPRPASEGRQGR